MSTKTATAVLEGSGLRFSVATGSGHTVVVDDGDGGTGPRPAELVVVAQAGCTAMDVIFILRKKRQDVRRYEVHVEGIQRDADHPHVFERMDVLHVVEGPAVEVEAVRRAIELSATRYCTVTANLSAGLAEIHHRYRVRSADGTAVEGEAVITGPDGRVEVVSPALATP